MSQASLSGDLVSSISEIHALLGRPLRVLHIGNIANNAYNNARIQRQFGIEADVLCYDYYHVMATPEWEDGGLETKVNSALPNWWESNLKGFRRPDWFVQGPVDLCLRYLEAHRSGDKQKKLLARSALESSYLELLRLEAISRNEPWTNPRFRKHHRVFWRSWLAVLSGSSAMERGPASHGHRVMLMHWWSEFKDFASRGAVACGSTWKGSFRVSIWPLILDATESSPKVAGSFLILGIARAVGRLRSRPYRNKAYLRELALDLGVANIDPSWSATLRRVTRLVFRLVALSPFALFRWVFERDSAQVELAAASREARAQEFARVMLANEPADDVDFALREQFVRYVADHTLRFGSILEHYDVVQGYSIDGIIPLANGATSFASYEHGTLRDIPFEKSLLGLVCRVTYRNSPLVFVTNTDVLPSVRRLGLAPECVHNLPHAFDDQKLIGWRDRNIELVPPSAEAVFFSPTRHHWVDNNPSLTKGNNIMLEAAGRLWQEGRRFRLVFVDWGQDVAASKKLIQDYGFEAAVSWVVPMGKQELWRAYCTSHAVLDQFMLPALGGVGFETLALGRRLISRTDQPTLAEFFGEAPPVLPAATVEDVASSMAVIMDDLDDAAGLGRAGRDWIENYHSARRTVEIQARAYKAMLETKLQAAA